MGSDKARNAPSALLCRRWEGRGEDGGGGGAGKKKEDRWHLR